MEVWGYEPFENDAALDDLWTISEMLFNRAKRQYEEESWTELRGTIQFLIDSKRLYSIDWETIKEMIGYLENIPITWYREWEIPTNVGISVDKQVDALHAIGIKFYGSRWDMLGLPDAYLTDPVMPYRAGVRIGIDR